MTEKSCGTIPYTQKNGVFLYLLVKNRADGFCGFPKGHVESGETEEETAYRETWEETSVRVNIHSGFRYEMSYPMTNGNQKTVVYFLADFRNQIPVRNHNFEDFLYLLLPYKEAYRKLTFENTRVMLKEAHEFLIQQNEADTARR